MRDADATRLPDANALARHLAWLNTHLTSPDLKDEEFRAIFWFKDTALAPMQHIWAMKPHLEAYGHFIDIVKTDRPGQIVYEDGWQIAARPCRR